MTTNLQKTEEIHEYFSPERKRVREDRLQDHSCLVEILIWLKMALKYIVIIKARNFYDHKDPPFDMKHQLMSADHVPVLKIDLR